MTPLYEILFAATVLTAPDTSYTVPDTSYTMPPREPDAWIAEDKFRHAATSFAATAFVQAGVRSAGVPTDTAVPIAAAVAGIAGIGKEVHDRMNGGTFSIRDLAWDALGIIAGVMVTSQAR